MDGVADQSRVGEGGGELEVMDGAADQSGVGEGGGDWELMDGAADQWALRGGGKSRGGRGGRQPSCYREVSE